MFTTGPTRLSRATLASFLTSFQASFLTRHRTKPPPSLTTSSSTKNSTFCTFLWLKSPHTPTSASTSTKTALRRVNCVRKSCFESLVALRWTSTSWFLTIQRATGVLPGRWSSRCRKNAVWRLQTQTRRLARAPLTCRHPTRSFSATSTSSTGLSAS